MTTTREQNILAIAKQFEILNPKIEGCTTTEKGDNYLGELSFVTITGTNKNLELVYKAASNNANMREKAFVHEAFANEVVFFNEIVPMMKEIHENEEHIDVIGECYAASAECLNEYLILENLNTSGYTMWNRKIPLNKEHMIAVFEMYAKFHALSVGLKERNPEGFANVVGKLVDVAAMYEESEAKFGNFASMMEKIVNYFKDVMDVKIYEQFKKFCNEMSFSALGSQKSKHFLLIHGDSWCNNMLFKYNETDKTKPEAVKLIDFQLIYPGPAVNDLSTILYGCGAKETLDCLDELLEIYHKTFAERAKSLGVQKIITLEELKEEWLKHGSYGMVAAFFFIKIMVSDNDETPDLRETEASLISAYNYDSKHDDEFYARLEDVIVHCYKIGIF